MKINAIYVALTVAMSVAVTAAMVVTLTMTGFDYKQSSKKRGFQELKPIQKNWEKCYFSHSQVVTIDKYSTQTLI